MSAVGSGHQIRRQEIPSQASGSVRTSAAASALAGRLPEAQRAGARLRELDPSLRVSNLGNFIPLRRAEHFARLAEGLRTAGLPE